jgi:hypothetical protein
MNINIALYEKKFTVVTKCFLSEKSNVNIFCSELTKIWITYRDERLKIEESWDRPYDKELISDYLQGKLNSQEFGEQYSKLWGLAESKNFDDAINSLHSLCSCYDPNPQGEWDVDEIAFRSEVTNIFDKYKEP